MQIHQTVESLINKLKESDKFKNHQFSNEQGDYLEIGVERYDKLFLTENSSRHQLNQYKIEIRNRLGQALSTPIRYDQYSDTFRNDNGVITFDEAFVSLQLAIERN